VVRKFGVELEVVTPGRYQDQSRDFCVRVMNRALTSGGWRDSRNRDYTHEVTEYWKAVHDGSVSDGSEMVSPILYGKDGEKQVQAVCREVNKEGDNFRISTSCGVHVHLDVMSAAWAPNFWEKGMGDLGHSGYENETRSACEEIRRRSPKMRRIFNRLLDAYRWFDPALRQITPPSRHDLGYCAPFEENVSADEWFEKVRPNNDRYSDTRYYRINFGTCLGAYGTVEFRMHQGSTNSEKIMQWTRLCQKFLTFSYAPERAHLDPINFSRDLEGMFECLGMSAGQKRFWRNRAEQLNNTAQGIPVSRQESLLEAMGMSDEIVRIYEGTTEDPLEVEGREEDLGYDAGALVGEAEARQHVFEGSVYGDPPAILGAAEIAYNEMDRYDSNAFETGWVAGWRRSYMETVNIFHEGVESDEFTMDREQFSGASANTLGIQAGNLAAIEDFNDREFAEGQEDTIHTDDIERALARGDGDVVLSRTAANITAYREAYEEAYRNRYSALRITLFNDMVDRFEARGSTAGRTFYHVLKSVDDPKRLDPIFADDYLVEIDEAFENAWDEQLSVGDRRLFSRDQFLVVYKQFWIRGMREAQLREEREVEARTILGMESVTVTLGGGATVTPEETFGYGTPAELQPNEWTAQEVRETLVIEPDTEISRLYVVVPELLPEGQGDVDYQATRTSEYGIGLELVGRYEWANELEDDVWMVYGENANIDDFLLHEGLRDSITFLREDGTWGEPGSSAHTTETGTADELFGVE
jgi:hypothetical protein